MKGSPPFPADEREESLVNGLSCGNPDSVHDFLEATHRPVYLMATRLTRDDDLRHDWTHEVLLKIVEELGRGRFEYRWPGCFWSWFQKRSYFLLINLYRRQKQHEGRWTSGEIGEEILERMDLPGDLDPSEMIETVEARDALETCLDRLVRTEHRDALHLLLFEEQSYQEIAERLDTALNTVRSWIRRARTAVRECLAAHYDLEDSSWE